MLFGFCEETLIHHFAFRILMYVLLLILAFSTSSSFSLYVFSFSELNLKVGAII